MARSLAKILVTTWILILGCNPEDPGEPPTPSPATSVDDVEVTKDTQGVLFTWVDGDGQFHITEKAEEVPASFRSVVRIVVEGKAPGTADQVFVADLTQMQAKFPVTAMPRKQWEDLGRAAREKRIAELRPKEEPQPPSPFDLGVDAIVYGAEWCKPCHLAEDYLKKKGARVVKKDIEEDLQAAAEMKQKLQAAGLSGSSIPVLDVGGTILRGFSAPSIDRALSLAKK